MMAIRGNLDFVSTVMNYAVKSSTSVKTGDTCFVEENVKIIRKNFFKKLQQI